MFTIDNENNILTRPAQDAAEPVEAASVESFSSQTELAGLAAMWPTNRLVAIWNGFAGAGPFDDLKPLNKFKDRKTAIARIWSAIQRLDLNGAPEAAEHAPEAVSSTKQATAKERAPQAPKAAKKGKAKKADAPKKATATREVNKTAAVLELIRKPKGATLKEIMAYASHCTSLA